MHSEIYPLIRETGKSTSEISSANGQSETWLFEVLSGKESCTAAQLEQLADILKVTPEYLKYLIKNTELNQESGFSKIMWLLLDKVVIGFVVLAIALGIQWHYEKYATQRDKAVAASNLQSDYFKKTFSTFQSSFVSLLSASDAILSTKGGSFDSKKNQRKLAEVIQYETGIKC